MSFTHKFNAIANYFQVRPVIVNSVPKSGTNLLKKAVCLLPGIQWSQCHIGARTAKKPKVSDGEVPVGVDRPVEVTPSWFERKLQGVRNGKVLTCHVPYSKNACQIINKLGCKVLIIVRHPAAVALSHSNYIYRESSHFAHKHYKKLDFESRVKASITGLPEVGMKGMACRYRSILEWKKTDYSLLVRFEELVGDQGGGEAESQVKALERIAEHCNIRISSDSIHRHAKNIYGGTHTFKRGRGGKVGEWKNDILSSHLDILMKEMGEIARRLDYSLKD